ncbi:MAG: hypothetical protein ABIR18_04695 [Chitinophagaceae bacterium]
MKSLLILLLFPAYAICQDTSIVKWKAIKKGKDPTTISLTITAEIKENYFIHPFEDCSVNSWNDQGTQTRVTIDADSNWKVNYVFNKNKYKQWTRFNKTPYEKKRDEIKGKDTTQVSYTEIEYTVDCRVYDDMKLFRGIELVPSEGAITRYNLSLPALPENAKDKDDKEREKEIKDAAKTLLKILPPPNELFITITYEILNRRNVTVLTVPNTYKSKKKWGWKKAPRPVLNK